MDRDRHGIKKIADMLKMSPPENLSPNFAEQVVSAALNRRRKPWPEKLRALWDKLFQPRQVWLRPAWQIAWALLFCLIGAGTTGWVLRDASQESAAVRVRFAIEAPAARQVALAGDFNAWKSDAMQLEDPDGDGIWHGVIHLAPGVYQYMFVIDDEQWIADPLGDKTVDDGFGQKNSLLKVVHYRRPDREKTHAL